MVQVFLIVVAVCMAILILAACLLLLIKFGHPDDKSAAYFPKFIVLLGLWLSFASVLVLPFDIANRSTAVDNGGIAVDTLWQTVYWTLAVLVCAVIPFAFFYYESDVDAEDLGPDAGFFDKQIGSAICYAGIFMIVIMVILIILYTTSNTAYVPVNRITMDLKTVVPVQSDINPLTTLNPTLQRFATASCPGKTSKIASDSLCVRDTFTWEIPVSVTLYIIAFLAFIGWFFFTLFVAVGLAALPLDLINEYRTRPTPISTKTYFEQRNELGKRVKTLIEQGEKMQQSHEQDKGNRFLAANRHRTDVRNFEKNYYLLKKDYQILHVAFKLKGGNPLWYFFKLFLGIIALLLSVTWVLHIAMFILPRESIRYNFLNKLMTDVSIPGFELFPVLFFAIYSFYLLWCVVKGNFKLGVRFLFFKIYPMELENTLMNAFLWNTWFILLCSLPTVQFCVTAFPGYVATSQANIMFGDLVTYMAGFRTLFSNKVFIFAIIVLFGISLAVLLIWPNSESQKIEKQLDKLSKAKNTSLTDYNDD